MFSDTSFRILLLVFLFHLHPVCKFFIQFCWTQIAIAFIFVVFCAIFLGVFCTPVPDGSLNTPLSGLAMELSAPSCLIVVVGGLSI